MAERRRSRGKPDLTPDAAAPPAGEPPDTVPIYGILGKSPVASSVRLFLDVGLSTYYDVPIEGIAGREKVPADRSPLGVDSTLLFVRKGVQLVVHRTQTRSVEEEFVAGDFTTPGTFAPSPGIAPAGVGLGRAPETFVRAGCPPLSANMRCPSLHLCLRPMPHPSPMIRSCVNICQWTNFCE